MISVNGSKKFKIFKRQIDSMKIISISDLHGNYEVIGKLPKSDLLIIAGDITTNGPPEAVDKILKISKSKVLAVPGNWDTEDILQRMKEYKINIHDDFRVIDNIGIFGCGGTNSFIGTVLEFTEDKIEDILERNFEKVKDTKFKILVSHTPPYEHCDLTVMGSHVGSKAVAKFIGRVDLILSGHVHESRCIDEFKGTLIVNSGLGGAGQFAEITFDGNRFRAKLKNL